MKKCIMPLLAFVLCLSFTGCSLTNSKPLEPESGIKIIREEDTPDEEEEETPNVSEDTKDAQKKPSVYVKRDGGTVYISSIEKDGYEFFGTGDFGREKETKREIIEV